MNQLHSIAYELLNAIQRKCEQYWNEPNICDAEIHAVLENIHEAAGRAARSLNEPAA